MADTLRLAVAENLGASNEKLSWLSLTDASQGAFAPLNVLIIFNDNTIAGLRHREYPAFGVQYHPEASAGPHDSHYLFVRFRQLMADQVAIRSH